MAKFDMVMEYNRVDSFYIPECTEYIKHNYELQPKDYYLLYKCGIRSDNSNNELYYKHDNFDILVARNCILLYIKENKTFCEDDIILWQEYKDLMELFKTESAFGIYLGGNISFELLIKLTNNIQTPDIYIYNSKKILNKLLNLTWSDIGAETIFKYPDALIDTSLSMLLYTTYDRDVNDRNVVLTQTFDYYVLDNEVEKSPLLTEQHYSTKPLKLRIMDIHNISDLELWKLIIKRLFERGWKAFSPIDSLEIAQSSLRQFIWRSRLCREVNNIDIMTLFKDYLDNELFANFDFVDMNIW